MERGAEPYRIPRLEADGERLRAAGKVDTEAERDRLTAVGPVELTRRGEAPPPRQGAGWGKELAWDDTDRDLRTDTAELSLVPAHLSEDKTRCCC